MSEWVGVASGVSGNGSKARYHGLTIGSNRFETCASVFI